MPRDTSYSQAVVSSRCRRATAHGHRSRVLRTPNVVWLVVLGFWGAPLRVVTNVVNPRCFCVAFCPVVTNVVNPSAFSLKIVVFGLRLTTFVTGVLARRCESRWFDDVCNIGRPLVAWPGPASAHGRRSLALSARWAGCLKPSSPLRVPAEPRLKPPSPLRVRNERFWCSFRAQR